MVRRMMPSRGSAIARDRNVFIVFEAVRFKFRSEKDRGPAILLCLDWTEGFSERVEDGCPASRGGLQGREEVNSGKEPESRRSKNGTGMSERSQSRCGPGRFGEIFE
jgi:hypothetical protein